MAYGSPLPTLGSTTVGLCERADPGHIWGDGPVPVHDDRHDHQSGWVVPDHVHGRVARLSDYSFGFVPGTLTVSQAPTTLSLTPPPATGSSLTATVSSQFSGTPTGSVTFHVGTGTESCTLSSQTAGSASCTANVNPNISPGTYFVPVTYSGDADFKGSSSSEELTVPGSCDQRRPGNWSGRGTRSRLGARSGSVDANPTMASRRGD